jgi:putative chitinase
MNADQLLSVDKAIGPYIDALIAGCARYQINTPTRQAMFLAQCAHESGGFKLTRELWGPTSQQAGYDHRADLGNNLPEAVAFAAAHADTPGHFYAGHGLIQITGYFNHRDYSMDRYRDDRCARDPSLLKVQPDAAESACWFWSRHGLSAIADAGTDEAFVKITRRINGGINGLDDRRHRWAQYQAALGVEG